MNDLEIRRVTTHHDLKEFVEFPFGLYKGNAFWVPPLKHDELNTLRKDKNPAFEFCEAEYWLAFRNGKTVGRIAGIINPVEAQRSITRLVRFGWIDFIDDPEVSRALVNAVAAWGRSKGMTGMHGPCGFTNMDPEGMLTEGFGEMSSLSTIYNFPYYPVHMEMLGFSKSAGYIQFEIGISPEIPEKVERMTAIVMEKYKLKPLHLKNANDLLPYAGKLFSMYNEAFHDLYGFTALTPKQVEYYSERYLRYLRPDFISVLIDDKDDVIGFGITMPRLSEALRHVNGSLLPFGYLHLRKAFFNYDIIQMALIGVRPDYQGKGILAILYHMLHKSFIAKGVRLAQTNPQLEDNSKAISIWKNYASRVYARRSIWFREI